MRFRPTALLIICLLTRLAGAVEAAPSPDQARQTARAAYIWGYPIVEMYSILRSQALDPSSPEFKAPLNQVGHYRNVGTPEDKAVIAPNVDTPYSYAWLDLRDEPVVITVPHFEANRYLSLQISDLYTWIVDYVTPRTNGHNGGDFLVARAGWKGKVPRGIRKVFYVPTDLALGFFRTQLLNAEDLHRVHQLQDSIAIRPLSTYLGHPAPRTQSAIPPLIPAINLRREPTSLAFFDILGWMLRFMPPLPEETELRHALHDLGIIPGQIFSPDTATRTAVIEGMRAGLADIQARAATVRSSAEIFGTREYLGLDYTTRAAGAMLGILGNAAEEFLGIGYPADAEGKPFDGQKRYRIHFSPGALPPVGAFWSITAYTQERLLYANPVKRYVINSPMEPNLLRDSDGGFTLDIQHDSPGTTREQNWLPVPEGPFILTFRTYLPGEAIRQGTWTAPPVVPMTPDGTLNQH